ncbi:DUF2336 domain-containing protein [Temperatibacter marinus]|uniref:DUF2336 domain-containing protein n=1 Tax=Temperatibacter marinus TaxID=1456591 RepID=A0AA52ED06_9PROT|nr:DUF2336 domain-containing protein [Temperatibacter marinus]WND02430.1 DUF2336 domain-containing protein [Temperatibacter marinus]
MADQNLLSNTDVLNLLQDPSPENRAEAAKKVGEVFSSAELGDKEKGIAEDIFRAMLQDAAVRVRQALSESLQDNPEISKDIVSSLAQDIDEVALPMIQNSTVLSEADLIDIIDTRGETLQKAVAQRKDVSEAVADKLVDTANENVIGVLVSNDKAAISENTFTRVLDEFGENETINSSMAKRGELPINVAERLVTLVSDQLREHIMTHHEISASVASDLLLETREKATVGLLDGSDSQDVQSLVDQLYDNERLTPTLLIRAVCTGDTTFFETALAKMCGIPVANAYKIIHEGGAMGLSKAFERAKIPNQFVSVAQAAIDLTKEMVETGGDDKDMFHQLILERVLTNFEFLEEKMDGDSIDYLIGKLKTIEMPDQAA